MNKVKASLQFLRNMGLRYVLFRTFRLISTRTGIFRKRFPVNPSSVKTISLKGWKNDLPPFFFQGKNIPGLQVQRSEYLKNQFNEISEGTFTFFGKLKFHHGKDFDWVTNPVTGFKYDMNRHWSSINEFSEISGDIKFVWETARFSFIYDIIRYDFHYKTDCSQMVFSQIISFIDNNPVNRGPNYVCSQEISLRILNWTFALYYYKDSEYLSEDLFKKIMNSIYWQIHHVYQNINFSRIAVRNNHALTETLLLFLSGLLFPFIPETRKWSRKGKQWFEKEIAYQIYDDGTYLQFSNNYHRVVIQLLTWGIRLAELNKTEFSEAVSEKAKKSLIFLYDSMDRSSGMLPNYGANDGALFFKMNDQEFRDYRPQLQALSYALHLNSNHYHDGFMAEDIYWMSLNQNLTREDEIQKSSVSSYPSGGYYIIHDNDSMTYIRCGNHSDRPSQADNLHLDIWYKGVNVLRDNGSYLYNSEPDILKYFMGTRSHNTIMLDDFDQMLKGPRFIWFDWSQAPDAKLKDSGDKFEFDGSITAFTYLNKDIKHRRKVIKIKGKARWIVEDEISGTDKYELNQLWHFSPDFPGTVNIIANDMTGCALDKTVMEGWYSSYYGIKVKSEYFVYSTLSRKVITSIELDW